MLQLNFSVLELFHLRGYNIGVRLVDEFLAKSSVSRCVDFRETADVIAKVLSPILSSPYSFCATELMESVLPMKLGLTSMVYLIYSIKIT